MVTRNDDVETVMFEPKQLGVEADACEADSSVSGQSRPTIDSVIATINDISRQDIVLEPAFAIPSTKPTSAY